MRPLSRFLPLLLVASLMSACGSLTFPRHWTHAAPVRDDSGMPGRWSGSWESDWNGHSGGLRCVMSRRADGLYHAWFRASYAQILVFEHRTLFRITGGSDGALTFSGEQDLGEVFGGVYRYEGRVEGGRFEARYEAENGDHGVFRMERLPARAGD